MHRLRNARSLARLVLVWFALALGVAVASPLIKPDASTLVCSAGGVMKRVAADTDADAAPMLPSLLDCPLCLHVASPAPTASPGACPAPTSVRCTGGHVRDVDGPLAVRLPGCGPPSHA